MVSEEPMNWPTILFLVVVGIVALVAVELGERWWVRGMGRRLWREAMEMAERGETSTPLMPPESVRRRDFRTRRIVFIARRHNRERAMG